MSNARAFPLSPVSTKRPLDIGVEKAEEKLSERYHKWRTKNPYRPFRVYHLKLIFFLVVQLLEWIVQAVVSQEFYHDEDDEEDDRHRVTAISLMVFMLLPYGMIALVLTIGVQRQYQDRYQNDPSSNSPWRQWIILPLHFVINLVGYTVVDVSIVLVGLVFESFRCLYYLLRDLCTSKSYSVTILREKDPFIPPYRMRSYMFFRGAFQFLFQTWPNLIVILFAIIKDYDKEGKEKVIICFIITVASFLTNLSKILRFRKETKLSIWEPACHSLISFRLHGGHEAQKISTKVTATCSIEEFPWVDFYNDVYISMTLKPVPNDSLNYFKNVCRLAARTWHLQQFIASGISIADDGPLAISHITEAMRKNHGLKFLDLSRNIIANRGSVPLSELVGHSPTLTGLDISHNRIAEEGFSFLSNALKINVNLKILDVSHNPLGENSGMDIGNVLRLNYTLTDLKLNQCQFTDKSIAGIANGLQLNKALKRLWLRHNRIEAIGIESISRALVTNNTLNQLALEGNSIGDVGVQHLCTIFPHNNSISSIELVQNNIGDVGAASLGNSIWRSDMLQHVYLSSNQIGDEGMKGLAEGIEKAKVLTHVSLVCNRIGNGGMTHLAKALRSNTSLNELYLSGNRITDEGICALAEGLSENQTLRLLALEDNPFGEKGAGALCNTMRSHRGLENLIINGNSLSDTTIARLKSLRSARDHFRVSIRHKTRPILETGPSGAMTVSSVTHITADLETPTIPAQPSSRESPNIPVISSQYDDELRTTILAMENVTLGLESEIELNMNHGSD